MKNYLCFLFLLAFSAESFSQAKTDRKEIAMSFYNFLNIKDYEKALALTDTSYQSHVDAKRLDMMWSNVLAKGGAFKNTKEMVETVQPNYAIVVLPLVFEKRTTNLKFIFNKTGKLTGVNFLPEDLREKYNLPAYFDSAKVTESFVKVSAGFYTMPGTLSLPKGKKNTPAVVLVHGSGANDRDETVNSTKIFKDLALGLATKGVAVLRYEKRSKMFQARARKSEFTVRDETMDDVVAAYKSLKSIPSIDSTKIFLIGHGFGGMILPRIAKENPEIAGIFILVANAGRLEDLIYEQTAYLLSLDTITERKKNLLDSMQVQQQRIKLLSQTSANDTSVRLLFHAASYWYDLNQYNQVETVKELKTPVYIIHCERDYQVTMKDYNVWKKELELQKNVHFKLYPSLNHMFQEGTGLSSPAEYNKASNVPSYVINDLYGWINRKKEVITFSDE